MPPPSAAQLASDYLVDLPASLSCKRKVGPSLLRIAGGRTRTRIVLRATAAEHLKNARQVFEDCYAGDEDTLGLIKSFEWQVEEEDFAQRGDATES